MLAGKTRLDPLPPSQSAIRHCDELYCATGLLTVRQVRLRGARQIVGENLRLAGRRAVQRQLGNDLGIGLLIRRGEGGHVGVHVSDVHGGDLDGRKTLGHPPKTFRLG